MKVVIKYNVSSCTNCPHYVNMMDGPYCCVGDMKVYPEGRYAIHPKCPIKGKNNG